MVLAVPMGLPAVAGTAGAGAFQKGTALGLLQPSLDNPLTGAHAVMVNTVLTGADVDDEAALVERRQRRGGLRLRLHGRLPWNRGALRRLRGGTPSAATSSLLKYRFCTELPNTGTHCTHHT